MNSMVFIFSSSFHPTTPITTAQMPRTDASDVVLTVKSSFDADNNQAYISSGYLALSDFVTTFIMTVTCRTTKTCGPNESIQVNALGVAEFPNGKHINAGFWT